MKKFLLASSFILSLGSGAAFARTVPLVLNGTMPNAPSAKQKLFLLEREDGSYDLIQTRMSFDAQSGLITQNRRVAAALSCEIVSRESALCRGTSTESPEATSATLQVSRNARGSFDAILARGTMGADGAVSASLLGSDMSWTDR